MTESFDALIKSAQTIWSQVTFQSSTVPMKKRISQFMYLDPDEEKPKLDFYADDWEDRLNEWADTARKIVVDLSWKRIGDDFVAYISEIDLLLIWNKS